MNLVDFTFFFQIYIIFRIFRIIFQNESFHLAFLLFHVFNWSLFVILTHLYSSPKKKTILTTARENREKVEQTKSAQDKYKRTSRMRKVA